MRNPITGPILAFAGRLRFPTLFLVTAALFILDLLVPDMIPLVDEILLGLATLVFAAWKRRHDPRPPIDVQAR